jgi:SET domain-containing protein
MIRFRVAARPSRIEGLGLFAAQAIPARRKIGELTGRIIPVREARRLSKILRRIRLVDLSDREALDGSAGNALWRINHSCDANAYLRVARRRVEVYARRAIRRGEEITVDYGVSPHPGGLRCNCRSQSCRDRI